MIAILNILSVLLITAKTENILMTEVFAIPLEPTMFNWTYQGDPAQYIYQPSLLNSPDLPSWINYHYSTRYHTGYLYGVPNDSQHREVIVEVVALNRKNYETKHIVLPIYITEKLHPAKSEVHIKIDNLNVEDMFDSERMERLKNIFKKSLWKDSEEDLYITFLASAIQLGARFPLNPTDGEGVVLRIGSRAPLSTELIKLQKEVKPLWKHTSCPRDFKRTTVERIFRDAGFALDWCVFRLIEDRSYAMQHHSSTSSEALSNMENKQSITNQWDSIAREDVPIRSYTHEFAFTILLPIFIMIILALMLSFILCFDHEGICSEMDGDSKYTLNHYANVHLTAQSGHTKEMSAVSSDIISRSHAGSPTSARGVHCRPSPPPYVRPKFKSEL